ncbi:hypothetical protein [Pseudarthrobacter sp. NamE5]|uniref:hypothetical protein n=1 Tax=Pseudarthrobacter sp. NamE5 TaxID=2576839 RepID=UPI00110B60E8|nr:hypothetical protein [Pseudarthrobacter sp. NamE5]TLM87713.1 hypothetical protein FDW84_03770 [Pseudarthrobacter sp. NamE5]
MLNGVIGILFVLSFAIFLLPLIPIGLTYPDFHAHGAQAGVEVLLSVAAVVLALMLPAPKGP